MRFFTKRCWYRELTNTVTECRYDLLLHMNVLITDNPPPPNLGQHYSAINFGAFRGVENDLIEFVVDEMYGLQLTRLRRYNHITSRWYSLPYIYIFTCVYRTKQNTPFMNVGFKTTSHGLYPSETDAITAPKIWKYRRAEIILTNRQRLWAGLSQPLDQKNALDIIFKRAKQNSFWPTGSTEFCLLFRVSFLSWPSPLAWII